LSSTSYNLVLFFDEALAKEYAERIVEDEGEWSDETWWSREYREVFALNLDELDEGELQELSEIITAGDEEKLIDFFTCGALLHIYYAQLPSSDEEDDEDETEDTEDTEETADTAITSA
jgi:hypothetical protein